MICSAVMFHLFGSWAKVWILQIVVINALCIIPSLCALDQCVCVMLALEDGGFDQPVLCLDSISKESLLRFGVDRWMWAD